MDEKISNLFEKVSKEIEILDEKKNRNIENKKLKQPNKNTVESSTDRLNQAEERILGT